MHRTRAHTPGGGNRPGGGNSGELPKESEKSRYNLTCSGNEIHRIPYTYYQDPSRREEDDVARGTTGAPRSTPGQDMRNSRAPGFGDPGADGVTGSVATGTRATG